MTRYLWVDLYCIIQGNGLITQADWEGESLPMGKVYQNGLINAWQLQTFNKKEI